MDCCHTMAHPGVTPKGIGEGRSFQWVEFQVDLVISLAWREKESEGSICADFWTVTEGSSGRSGDVQERNENIRERLLGRGKQMALWKRHEVSGLRPTREQPPERPSYSSSGRQPEAVFGHCTLTLQARKYSDNGSRDRGHAWA